MSEVDTALVLAVLKPIWFTKPETASRLRARIEAVLGWSTVHGMRPEAAPNPARWDHLRNALPEKGSIREVKHHAALPFQELPSFFAKLTQPPGLAAKALQLAILCAVRTGDLIGSDREDSPPMMWSHVDLAGRTWLVPKTKNGSGPQDSVVGRRRRVARGYPPKPFRRRQRHRLRRRSAGPGNVEWRDAAGCLSHG